MRSHDLARFLLALPDLPVATHACNHSDFALEHDPTRMRVTLCRHYTEPHVMIGYVTRRKLNFPNYWITDSLGAPLANDWGFTERAYVGETKLRDADEGWLEKWRIGK